MQYSPDGTRLFSCGVGDAGVGSTLVEWNESDGAISRRYAGFHNDAQNLARFDTCGNRHLIVGDEGAVKVGPGMLCLLPLMPLSTQIHQLHV